MLTPEDKRYIRLELDDARNKLVEDVRHMLEESVTDIKDEMEEVIVEKLLMEIRGKQAPTP